MVLLKILVFFILSVSALSGAFAANNKKNGNCNDWLIKSVKWIESKPLENGAGLKIFLIQMSHACAQVPEKLIRAASSSINAEPDQRYKILQKAAASYFPDSCLDTHAAEPAKKLIHICQRDDFIDGFYSAILPNISAGEYMYGKALEKELKKNSNFNPYYAKRLMLNYFTSAAMLYEERNGL